MIYFIAFSSRYASTYGNSSYNSGTYNNSSTASTGTGGATNTNTGGLLTNTGFDVLLAVSLACLIIFATLIVRFWKRPKPESITTHTDA